MGREGIRADLIDTGTPWQSECYVVTERDGGWVAYYAERGLERSLTAFATEDEACRHVLGKLRADPSARR